MTMLESIRNSLRIKNTVFDGEITDLINACKLDLSISGVKIIDDTDPLIKQAVKTYVKANFGLDNKDGEKYMESYEAIKRHLALCGDYNVEPLVLPEVGV
ncbi:head-tail connector protein [Acetobacterium malicum]|uniref:head-tail connector protein n=1 Tax=Acetobacterium malicum TaxID=52692 RepID=UPI001FA6C84D|nr:head-tail connector protein [Acetobacterium dehalogenans]